MIGVFIVSGLSGLPFSWPSATVLFCQTQTPAVSELRSCPCFVLFYLHALPTGTTEDNVSWPAQWHSHVSEPEYHQVFVDPGSRCAQNQPSPLACLLGTSGSKCWIIGPTPAALSLHQSFAVRFGASRLSWKSRNDSVLQPICQTSRQHGN